MDSVKDGMRIKEVAITSDKKESKKKHVVPTPLTGLRE
jgi:hypothetical protein